MDKVQVIILAAGKGTRMKTEDPKALAKLKGRPFLKHILETVSGLNLFTKPIIVVGHQKEQIKEALGKKHKYAEQKEQLGTGHAVMSAKDSVHPNHKIILVLSVDQPIVSKETIQRIINTHLEKKPAITMATIVVLDFKDWRIGMNYFGRIIRGADGLVKKSIEYKEATEKEKGIKEVNPSIYAFAAEWLWANINKLKKENSKGEYYLTDLIEIASSQNEKIETVEVANPIEGLQPNSKEELEMLEKLA